MLETPKDPVKWPAYIFYFKPILILLNVIPFGLFLILFARVLDRYAANDWAWFFCPGRRGLRHVSPAVYTDPEQSHDRGLERVLRALPASCGSGTKAIARAGGSRWPASSRRSPRRTSCPPWRFWPCSWACSWSRVSPADPPVFSSRRRSCRSLRSLVAQYAVFGEFKLAYESFGTDEYLYEGSLWKTPLELDAFNEHPEPYGIYLSHMTLGHHGVFSLTPIFLFSCWGALRLLGDALSLLARVDLAHAAGLCGPGWVLLARHHGLESRWRTRSLSLGVIWPACSRGPCRRACGRSPGQ